MQLACAQAPAHRPYTVSEKFDQKISRTIDFDVPVIGVDELKSMKSEVLLFDTREKDEFEVSRIPGAQFLGYRSFDEAKLADVSKDTKIVLYCSIGYRSEKIGEKLQSMGYSNVYNLYGSIFEWVNQGNEVVDKAGKTTKKVHTYNKNWSKWVDNTKAERVW